MNDVKSLAPADLPRLAAELRERIVSVAAANGGHLASSLGAVEIAVALARVFEPAKDRVLWDVGHQSYAWKLLTGRGREFATVRKFGGVSGFQNPEESPCDAFVSGHAGVAFAAAEGMAAARRLTGGAEHVVAVVGDASFTNGENLEALNLCASRPDKVIVVLNDNEMSISRNVGAVARMLGRLISGVRYNRVKTAAEAAGHRLRLTFLRGVYHNLESRVKSLWLGNAYFERFGLRYVGPVDGHDLAALEAAFTVAREDKRSVLVHVVTKKGRGFAPAERNPTLWHGVGPFDPSCPAIPPPAAPSWSDVFGDALCGIAERDGRVCALTAAMTHGTGLAPFASRFPSRFFDSGISEEHVVTFAAGLAKAGMRPVVALYSTFLQRAVDQVMHDVCLLNLPVVFAVDRAGCVGADGRTHHGMFDLAMLRCLPNLTIAQPKDADELRRMLALAFAKGGAWVIRYPRGTPPTFASPSSPIAFGRAEQLSNPDAPIQIWALGEQVAKARAVAELLAEDGIAVGVVNARFVKPLDADLLRAQVSRGAKIVTIENAALAGGFGSAVLEAAPGADVMRFGWPDEFVSHGTVAELERAHNLAADQIASAIRARR